MISVEEISRVLASDDRYSVPEREDVLDEVEQQTTLDDDISYHRPLPPFVDTASSGQYHTGDVSSPLPFPFMTTALQVGVVDVYLIDPAQQPWRVLALQRSADTRCPGAWEAVHGRIEEEKKETPEQAAIREVREETGLTMQRLYNVTVHAFYLHRSTAVQLAVVFCGFVDSTAPVHLSHEHQAYEWLDLDAAAARYLWPRAGQALREIHKLLSAGNAGPAEDVLRIF
jgi:8-oxo-dGTP pyrophosphatase MutT (NUDIX family)